MHSEDAVFTVLDLRTVVWSCDRGHWLLSAVYSYIEKLVIMLIFSSKFVSLIGVVIFAYCIVIFGIQIRTAGSGRHGRA